MFESAWTTYGLKMGSRRHAFVVLSSDVYSSLRSNFGENFLKISFISSLISLMLRPVSLLLSGYPDSACCLGSSNALTSIIPCGNFLTIFVTSLFFSSLVSCIFTISYVLAVSAWWITMKRNRQRAM